MTATRPEEATQALVLEYELDAPPEKVWRAISIPALREHWLPNGALADAVEPVTTTPGQAIEVRLRDGEPPFLESTVTFRVRPNDDGGSVLTIVHWLTDARVRRRAPEAANDGGAPLMLAA